MTPARLLPLTAAAVTVLALLALWLRTREAPAGAARDQPSHVRELYLEQGRQWLLAGDRGRSLVFLSAAYRGAEDDESLRFLVARAAEGWRAKVPALRDPEEPVELREVKLASGSGEPWTSADLNGDWTRIVAVDAGGEASVFDARDGRRVARLAGAPVPPILVAFSPRGERVAGAHAGGRFSLWHADTGDIAVTTLGRAPRSSADALALAFSADGRRLATAAADGVVRLWDPADGALVESFKTEPARTEPARTEPAGLLAFRPDGRRLVTVSGAVAMIRNLETGLPIVSLDLPRDARVSALVYSPDGRRILAVGGPPEVRLFDAATGELSAFLTGHRGTVSRAAFSPGGGLIVTAGDDGTARIWDAERGRLLAVYPLPASGVIHAEYGPRGSRIATVHADGTVAVRRVALDDLGATETERLLRCFVPWRLASGRLLPATPDPRACHELRPDSQDDLAFTPLPGELAGGPSAPRPRQPEVSPGSVTETAMFGSLRFVLRQGRRQLAPGSEVLSGGPLPAGQPIDMSLRDADLRETLRSLASAAGADVLIAPDVVGLVSVELHDVPCDRVLVALLRLYDLELEITGRYWRIRRRPESGEP